MCVTIREMLAEGCACARACVSACVHVYGKGTGGGGREKKKPLSRIPNGCSHVVPINRRHADVDQLSGWAGEEQAQSECIFVRGPIRALFGMAPSCALSRSPHPIILHRNVEERHSLAAGAIPSANSSQPVELSNTHTHTRTWKSWGLDASQTRSMAVRPSCTAVTAERGFDGPQITRWDGDETLRATALAWCASNVPAEKKRRKRHMSRWGANRLKVY